VEFAYSVRQQTGARMPYPFDYRIPEVLRPRLAGRRVAIVNDVINAGSAVLGTYRSLQDCGAQSVRPGKPADPRRLGTGVGLPGRHRPGEHRPLAERDLAPARVPAVRGGRPLSG
jgi:orotate phosphoribosyltransferase